MKKVIIITWTFASLFTALIMSCGEKEKKPVTLADKIVDNIKDSTQTWVMNDAPIDTTGSEEYAQIQMWNLTQYLENKACNIKIEISGYYDLKNVTMVQPDTFYFNDDEKHDILRAYHLAYVQKRQQQYADSCGIARKNIENKIINSLCKK